jgi:hypothetical protein
MRIHSVRLILARSILSTACHPHVHSSPQSCGSNCAVGQLKRSGLAMYQSKGWRGWFCTPRIPRHRPWAPVDFRVRSIGEHGPASFASGAFTLVDEVDYVVREFHGAGARRPVKVEPMNLAFRLHKLHFTGTHVPTTGPSRIWPPARATAATTQPGGPAG